MSDKFKYIQVGSEVYFANLSGTLAESLESYYLYEER